ncbi:MAG TPA: DUF1289 domain-containing protein, partial [Pseudomonas sp.]|nr:DUF1289 domain-containing protein [Pseudomonas sp.]
MDKSLRCAAGHQTCSAMSSQRIKTPCIGL